MARDEIMIVERVHEGSFRSRKRAIVERFPGDLVRHRNELCAKRAHPLDFRRWRRLYDHDRARHARLSRGICDALSGISRTDRPDTPLALGLRQHRHGVGRAPQFVRVDRLQVLQFESDIGKVRSDFEPDQRRAHTDPGNSLTRFLYLGQFYRTDSFERSGH